ncbi:MAG: ImmA/IrrE family metallo-endopeptidase [Lachnospiraceae bacterium]|nr:ImmA/IrrE family metallo-endopeptidase [Lachnospiraceae bacterium]
MLQLNYRVRNDGVPILKNKNIEDDAEYILSQYDDTLLTNPHPIDVEDFTERFLGYNIHFENLSFNGCIWGRMVFNNRRILVYDPEKKDIAYRPIDENTVVIDNSLLEAPNEYAFRSTMIHECGHGLYHSQIYKENENQLSFFPTNNDEKIAITACRSSDVQGSGKRELITKHDWIEHHAKYFSAAILMPRPAMHIVCYDKKLRDNKFLSPEMKLDLLTERVSDTFNVSPASARIRINQLGYGIDNIKQRKLFTFENDETVYSI